MFLTFFNTVIFFLSLPVFLSSSLMMLNYVTAKLFFIYIYSRTKKKKKRVHLHRGQGQTQRNWKCDGSNTNKTCHRFGHDLNRWRSSKNIHWHFRISFSESRPKVDLIELCCYLMEFLFLFSLTLTWVFISSEFNCSLVLSQCLIDWVRLSSPFAPFLSFLLLRLLVCLFVLHLQLHISTMNKQTRFQPMQDTFLFCAMLTVWSVKNKHLENL